MSAICPNAKAWLRFFRLISIAFSFVHLTALSAFPEDAPLVPSRPSKLRLRERFASERTAEQEPEALPKPKAAELAKAAEPPKSVEVEFEVMPIDLPTALRLAEGDNPTINLARERVREAYARLDQAEVLLLPNLRFGPAYQRHDGQIQNSRGEVFGVSKSNLFVGGGAAISLEFSDALFTPLIARRLVQAEDHAARAVSNNVQLSVALTYLDLLRVHGQLAINADTLRRAEEMLQNAEVAARPGIGLSKYTSDVTRARAEVASRQRERLDLEGDAGTVSARLAQLLLLRPTVDLQPADPAVVPVTLVPLDLPLDELVATGLLSRPELGEGRELIAAAVARWRQARVGPLVPRLDFTYFAGDFGGGINDKMGNFSARSDGLAQLTWELHNFGAGDIARARERRSQVTQASLHVVEVEAQVAAEVSAAAKTARTRLKSLAASEKAVTEALETWRRLRAASFGMASKQKLYEALEPLIAEQALAQARAQYLEGIIEYNRAQFRLFTAMGQPSLEALPKAVAEKVRVPALPEPPKKP
ncbi:MAG: TolC family protein [Gemmataceae bacterium]